MSAVAARQRCPRRAGWRLSPSLIRSLPRSAAQLLVFAAPEPLGVARVRRRRDTGDRAGVGRGAVATRGRRLPAG